MSRLDEIRARTEAATPGPWRWSDEYHNDLLPPDMESWAPGVAIISVWGHDFEMNWRNEEADADFIAHAREDIPYLLAEIKRLERGVRHERGNRIEQVRVKREGRRRLIAHMESKFPEGKWGYDCPEADCIIILADQADLDEHVAEGRHFL